MIRVSVVGATGYTGGELLRLLLRHPKVKIVHVTSQSQPGIPVSFVHKDLSRHCDLILEAYGEALAKTSDVLFLALPTGQAITLADELMKLGKKVIDLSADFRLKNPKEFEAWYKVNHSAETHLKHAVYGLPELYASRIAKAKLVANPGCYATAVVLGAAPLLARKLAKPSFVADAKSGVSGAGKKIESKYHFVEVNENFSAYAVAKHRHMPEMEQVLSDTAKQKVEITFAPHLLPMSRGILATLYLELKKKASREELLKLYKAFYAKAPFVRVRALGEFPETKDVLHTNFCDIGLTVDERTGRVVVISAIDNLTKGASGQAIQNMNLMMGLAETEGLF